MQSYSKPVVGATTFGSLYALLSNTFDTLLSQFSGTAFPGSPVAGQPCYRTDRLTSNGIPKLYIYSGNTGLGEGGWVEPSANSVIGEEVINSRGTKSSLDQRLDVALNEDGTLKASTTLNPSQWFLPSLTFTYVSTTSFTVNGDQTDIYKIGRRMKLNLNASTVYSEVVSATYSSPNTTVTVLDAVLTNPLVSAEHSLFLPDWDGKSAISTRMVGNKRVKLVSADYTATLNDDIILVDASGAACTITLLSAVTMGAGREIEVVKIDSSANTVTSDASGAQTINGALTKVFTAQYESAIMKSDGANLYLPVPPTATTADFLNAVWTTPSYSAGNFTANGSMTWTVDSGDVITYEYVIFGKMMFLIFTVSASSIGGTPNTDLLLTIPASKVVAKEAHGHADFVLGATWISGSARAIIGDTKIHILRSDGAVFPALTDTAYVRGQLFFEIQ